MEVGGTEAFAPIGTSGDNAASGYHAAFGHYFACWKQPVLDGITRGFYPHHYFEAGFYLWPNGEERQNLGDRLAHFTTLALTFNRTLIKTDSQAEVYEPTG